jgi:hypothetical protein
MEQVFYQGLWESNTLMHVQRNGDSGSPRLVGSTNRSRSSRRVVQCHRGLPTTTTPTDATFAGAHTWLLDFPNSLLKWVTSSNW